MSEKATQTLQKKVYLYQSLLYGTICLILVLPPFLQLYCSASIASFLSFFLVVTARAFFETRFLYGIPLAKAQFQKITILSLATAALMTIFVIFFKPKFGWYAIPFSIFFASTVVGKLKARLWSNGKPPSGERAQLAVKIRNSTWITYGFYAIFVPLTVLLYTSYGVWFFTAVSVGYFFGAVFEELCYVRLLATQQLTAQRVLLSFFLSMICSGLAALSIFATMNFFGLSTQTSTIVGIVIAKLIQPLARKIIQRS